MDDAWLLCPRHIEEIRQLPHNNIQSDSDYDQIRHFPATGEYCKWSHSTTENGMTCAKSLITTMTSIHSEYLLPKHNITEYKILFVFPQICPINKYGHL